MKSILFKDWAIKAIREGRKTVTRRVDKLANEIASHYDRTWVHFDRNYNWWLIEGRSKFTDLIESFVIKPRYQAGDVVYIKEAWAIKDCGKLVSIEKEVWPAGWPIDRLIYKLDEKIWPEYSSRPSLFMPEWAARYFIKILKVDAKYFVLANLTKEELEKEGGEQALEILKDNDHKWVFRYEFMRQ